MESFKLCVLILAFVTVARGSSDANLVTYVHDKITIDLPAFAELVIETQPDRILLVTVENAEFLNSHGVVYVKESDEAKPRVVKETKFYTKSNSLVVQYKPFKSGAAIRLKIEKATGCPLNLGANSQCGRVVDDVSCYCITYTPRTWADTKAYCIENGLQLVSIETQREDQAIWASWSAYEDTWSSLIDQSCNGNWIWDSTGQAAGYTNWCIGQPDNLGNERCMRNWSKKAFCWDNAACNLLINGVCEIQP